LNSPLLRELESALDSARTDPNVKGLIITATAGELFSAGADLVELYGLNEAEIMAYLELGHRVLGKIERMGKPSLAALNGSAMGGGLELALACSMRVAAEHVMFGLPEVRLGVIPGFGGTQRLPKTIGRGRAHQMILTGDSYTARQALEFGLVNEVTSQEALSQLSTALMKAIIRNPDEAITAALVALGDIDEASFDAAMARERQLCCSRLSSPQAKRRIASFNFFRK
jgi:enoyl-CoA hydratase